MKCNETHVSCENCNISMKRCRSINCSRTIANGGTILKGFCSGFCEKEFSKKKAEQGFTLKIFKSKPGEISPESSWVCNDHEGYLYIADTLPELLKQVSEEFRNDKHLVG